MADDFQNGTFETPKPGHAVGEAEGWTWTSSQAGAAWADFNQAQHLGVVRLTTPRTGVLFSDFENGKEVDGVTLATGDRILIKNQDDAKENGVYLVQASGAPARDPDMGTGDNASDLYVYTEAGNINGGRGYRCSNAPGSDVVDTDELRFVVSAPPDLVAQERFESAWSGNQNWVEDYLDAILGPAIFSEDTPRESPYESHEWYDPLDELPGPTEAPFTGWAGASYPMDQEDFEDDWQNEFYSEPSWRPNSALNGRLTGSAVALPINIPANRNKLWIFHTGHSEADAMLAYSIPSGSYTTAASLETALQNAYDAAVSPDPCPVTWEVAEDESGNVTVSVGWPGGNAVDELLYFAVETGEEAKDCRALLGLDAWAPLRPGVQAPSSELGLTPAGIMYSVDVFSLLNYHVLNDAEVGGFWVYDYGLEPAVFDTAISDDKVADPFLLTGWYGAGATWKTDYDPGDLTAAVFDTDGTPEPYEDFEELWDEETLSF